MSFTLRFNDNIDNWNAALEQIMAVPSYKKFFEITSPHKPVVVSNTSCAGVPNTLGYCHLNCHKAELEGIGTHVSGWYVMCEFLHNEIPTGMCRLIHHSNILLSDGTLINPTVDYGRSHHIFLRDDERVFDLQNNVGYNDRMVFGDAFLRGHHTSRPVPRNKVLYTARGHFDRDPIFEKFTFYYTPKDLWAAVPKCLHPSKVGSWIALKTNCSIDGP
jgi:hypothetical protein